MAFLPDNNLAYPVLISIGESIGSGFYCNTPEATYLATAKHVLFENDAPISDHAILTSIGNDLVTKIVLKLDCLALFLEGNLRKHDNADVAVAKIATLQDNSMTLLAAVTKASAAPPGVGLLGMSMANTLTFEQVGISNEVILFGYPTSLGMDSQLDRSRPLLRRGIVAGKTENNRIVIDCPVYFGNSGGLVIEIVQTELGKWQFKGIGMAVEMIPFIEELWSKQFKARTGLRFENSGYSLVEPFDRVTELF